MKKAKSGILVASKRKLTEILTGEILPKKEKESLADDLLFGAQRIAEYTA
jgi:hypothetical protein